jgi:hypothetical protein
MVISRGRYCSETEILAAIELLGRDGYDLIWECSSYVHMELVLEPPDRAPFWERFTQVGAPRSAEPRDCVSRESGIMMKPLLETAQSPDAV